MGKEDIRSLIDELSSPLDLSNGSVGIILAAGHGKRIKSEKSKMLHEIWGVPTVVRVRSALDGGLDNSAQIVVVGIKAEEVAKSVGKDDNLKFVVQEAQRGTGDAVKIAMEAIEGADFSGDVYIVPGDMGLIDEHTIKSFKESFETSKADMMVLTGEYAGDPENNQYGRIIRVPEKFDDGSSAGSLAGEVAEIKEYKDILAMKDDEPYEVKHKGKIFVLNKQDMLNLSEFNTGVYAFKDGSLKEHLESLTTENVQGELYVTDLIKIFNENDKKVHAANANDSRLVEGFNLKSTLREMEAIARERVYEKLKDVITIEDRYDFFISDEVVDRIFELDEAGKAGDIHVHKGVSLGPGVHLSEGVEIFDHCQLSGTVYIGPGTNLGERVLMSNFPGQEIKIGANTTILNGNEIKGEVKVGKNCVIESRVFITGSNEYPVEIGDDVHLRGVTYIFGSIIESGVKITHSVLKRKLVKKISEDQNGEKSSKVRFILPPTEGEEAVTDL
ncbi:MAG: NTP transferase domain-containing protein [Candidatus Marinimicrobia bacterium]|nr:NTP transferase domain-containing protein [Candidatus Neomarinimicrobiota bacterium]